MIYSIELIEFATPLYDLSIKLRTDILRIPLGLSFSTSSLSEEYQDYHLACFDNHRKLVGCLVLSPKSNGDVKMRQVGVLESAQRMGIGTLLVNASEDFAKDLGFNTMVLNARDTAVPFYQNLNYHIVGDSFTEVGIVHHKMVKKIQ